MVFEQKWYMTCIKSIITQFRLNAFRFKRHCRLQLQYVVWFHYYLNVLMFINNKTKRVQKYVVVVIDSDVGGGGCLTKCGSPNSQKLWFVENAGKSLKNRAESLKISAKSLHIWAKMAPNVAKLRKMPPNVCSKKREDHFLEVTPQTRLAKVARQLFGQV